MSEKNFKTRIIHKHDLESNWLLATNFTPKQGELIVYDVDSTHPYERFKIGDGVHNVNTLPFIAEAMTIAEIDAICGSTVEDIVGGTTVTHDGNGNVVIS